MDKEKLCEIARSFSWTVQVQPFSPRSFFCSQKMEVPIERAEEASKQLFHFCKMTVERDVAEYIKENTPESEKVIDVGIPYEEQARMDKIQDKMGL